VTNKSKILFLDIDGVLNSDEDWVETQVLGHPYNKGFDHLNRTKIALLELLIKNTDAKIVLSSTWRKSVSLDTLHRKLVERGSTLKREVFIGVTEELGFCRGDEIQAYLEEFSPETYAIVDDNDDMLETQAEHFVQTDGTRGLSLADVRLLSHILK
jgi:hypothetical protein